MSRREIQNFRRWGCERKVFFSGTELRCLQLEEVFTEAGSDLSMGPMICGFEEIKLLEVKLMQDVLEHGLKSTQTIEDAVRKID
jgi:hypothetical protein